MKTFETELPDGYRQVYSIDAKDQKTALLLNGGGLVLLVLVLLPFALTMDFKALFDSFDLATIGLFYLIFLGGLIAYMVLHELVHGAAYKLLTHRKLTFGISWSCAYCGVPDIYVYRRTALISLLAPFVTFTVILLPLTLAFRNNPVVYTSLALLFACHISGCSGDLYDTVLLLFRLRDPRLLMRDTGPAQTFYLPKQ